MNFRDTMSRAAGMAKDATVQAVETYRAPEAVAQRQDAAVKAARKAQRRDEKAAHRALHLRRYRMSTT